ERARVAIAGHGASEAWISLIWEIVQIKDRSQRLWPGFAAPDIQIPIQVKVFVATDARNLLLFSAYRARDLSQRQCRIQHAKLLLHALDCRQRFAHSLSRLIEQRRVFAVNEGARAKRLASRV